MGNLGKHHPNCYFVAVGLFIYTLRTCSFDLSVRVSNRTQKNPEYMWSLIWEDVRCGARPGSLSRYRTRSGWAVISLIDTNNKFNCSEFFSSSSSVCAADMNYTPSAMLQAPVPLSSFSSVAYWTSVTVVPFMKRRNHWNLAPLCPFCLYLCLPGKHLECDFCLSAEWSECPFRFLFDLSPLTCEHPFLSFGVLTSLWPLWTPVTPDGC